LSAEVVAVLRGYGFDTFSSKLGGVGVKWHSEYPKIDVNADIPPFSASGTSSAAMQDHPDGNITTSLTESR